MDLLSFLPPFFGVLVAFLIQRGWSWIEDRRARKKLLQSVKKELELSSGTRNLSVSLSLS